MSNMTRYDPFSIEPVSDLFHGLFRPLRGMTLADQPDLASMKIDVTENDGAYTVKAELPGVAKDDIDVQVTGNTVLDQREGRTQQRTEGRRARDPARTL